jgi:hypothetical protein
MFTLEGPHIVMSRTDAQNGLDFHFKNELNGVSTVGICLARLAGLYFNL